MQTSSKTLYFSAVCVQPCRNGGKCVKPGVCTCPHGYNGTYCETTIRTWSTRKQPHFSNSRWFGSDWLQLARFVGTVARASRLRATASVRPDIQGSLANKTSTSAKNTNPATKFVTTRPGVTVVNVRRTLLYKVMDSLVVKTVGRRNFAKF